MYAVIDSFNSSTIEGILDNSKVLRFFLYTCLPPFFGNLVFNARSILCYLILIFSSSKEIQFLSKCWPISCSVVESWLLSRLYFTALDKTNFLHLYVLHQNYNTQCTYIKNVWMQAGIIKNKNYSRFKAFSEGARSPYEAV